MIVYRIGRTKYARDLTGEGARLFGGRWNHRFTPCIYTSESRALALLEYTANINIDDIPRALSITIFEISLTDVLEIPIHLLPGDWTTSPAPASAKDYGTSRLKKAESPIIKFPSAILHEEYNYLLNPLLGNQSAYRIADVRDFVYDIRLKL
jgi:RES domain-containing protein